MRYGHFQEEVIFLKELSVFARCRGIPAREVARREGLVLRPRGSRHWALCPLHGEKTPSLMFDEQGRWHCFGCGRGGDAVALLSALRGISPLEAARQLAGEGPQHKADPRPAGRAQALKLKARADAWYAAQWEAACREKLEAEALQEALTPGTPAFWQALARQSLAETRLDALMALGPRDRVHAALTQETPSTS